MISVPCVAERVKMVHQPAFLTEKTTVVARLDPAGQRLKREGMLER